jgi:hypothetical protein
MIEDVQQHGESLVCQRGKLLGEGLIFPPLRRFGRLTCLDLRVDRSASPRDRPGRRLAHPWLPSAGWDLIDQPERLGLTHAFQPAAPPGNHGRDCALHSVRGFGAGRQPAMEAASMPAFGRSSPAAAAIVTQPGAAKRHKNPSKSCLQVALPNSWRNMLRRNMRRKPDMQSLGDPTGGRQPSLSDGAAVPLAFRITATGCQRTIPLWRRTACPLMSDLTGV